MKITEIINHPDFVFSETKITSKEWGPADWCIPVHETSKMVLGYDESDNGCDIHLNCDEDLQFWKEPKITETVTTYSRWVRTRADSEVMVMSASYLNKQHLLDATSEYYMVGEIIEDTIEVETRDGR